MRRERHGVRGLRSAAVLLFAGEMRVRRDILPQWVLRLEREVSNVVDGKLRPGRRSLCCLRQRTGVLCGEMPLQFYVVRERLLQRE